jgi:SNF2 family DNA or RNA helicase
MTPDQKEAFEWARKHPNCILALPMGWGKTRISIELIADHLSTKPNDRVMVMMPKNVLDTWSTEMSRWQPSMMDHKSHNKHRKKTVRGPSFRTVQSAKALESTRPSACALWTVA